MNYEFTTDEIKEVARAACIFCPSFSEQQYQDLMELEERLADSGYLESVRGLARLEDERGVSVTKVLDAYQELLSNREQLEAEVASLEEKLAAQQDANRGAEDSYQRMKKAVAQAKAELQRVQEEHQKEERELFALQKKAAREKRRIDKEVQEYRERANVTKEDVVTAGKLKAQVGSYGFSLELALGLSQEFASFENARDKLAEALKEHRTISNSIAALNEQSEEQKSTLQSELNKLQPERDRRQAEIKNLEQARHQMENILGQLQADVAHEDELRRFYHRYYASSGLLEYLASWGQVFFLYCSNPVYAMAGVFDRSAGGAHVWTDKPGPKCPHCGLNTLVYDEKFYQSLNLPIGSPIQLQLGE